MQLKLLRDYRTQLIETGHAAQTSFDRTLLTLSGGALGLSLTFVDKFIGDDVARATEWLWASWILWSASLAVMLASHYFGTLAMRKAVSQLDEGTIYDQKPGGFFDHLTGVLNPSGGVLFLAGVATIIVFAMSNAR